MIIPILFVIGLAYLGLKTGEAARKSKVQLPVIASGHGQPNKYHYRRLLKHRITNGGPVTKWLVNEATREAFEAGDFRAVSDITVAFPGAAVVSGEEITSEKQEEPDESEAGPEPIEAVGPSPLDGVSDEDWVDFVSKLRTKPAGFASDRYVGQFEQNRGRLKHLGISDPNSSEAEYKAIVADVEDRNHGATKLIADYSGEVVKVEGIDHAVTWSGILGLIKAAGPEGAEGWLTNPDDRMRFPHTTETFVRTNGCF